MLLRRFFSRWSMSNVSARAGECEPWLSSVGVPSDIVPADGDALGACDDAKLANGVPAPVLLFVINSTEVSKRSI